MSNITSRLRLRLVALLAIITAAAVVPAAEAALKHQYNFSEGATNDASGRTIVDSVGGMNGTVIGPAGAGLNPSATANALVLPGGTSDIAPYVDLPNGMISALTNATFEAWYTMDTVQNWARVFDFGSSTVGEVTAPGGGPFNGSDVIFHAATRGTGQGTQRTGLANNDPLFLGSEAGTVPSGTPDVDTNIPHALDVQRHVSIVYNATGGTGATPASLSVYVDGTLRGGSNTAVQLGNLNDVNNWLGRSNWAADSNLAGSLQEFRIYDHAMTTAEVHQRYIDGPNDPITPTVELDRDTGAITLLNEQTAVGVVGYTLTSQAGTLNPANWRPIADNADADSGGSFDSNHAWTKLTLTGSTQDFSEFDLSGGSGPFGGLFGAGGTTTYQLGTGGAAEAQRAWRTSFYEDIAIEMRLADGSALPVTVKYVGNNGNSQRRSDLNFDGIINLTDWNIFLSGNATNLSMMTMHESYLRGDVNGDLANNYQDFRLFKADFDAANGAGAFVAMIGVPEPSTLTILTLGCVATLSCRRRRAEQRSTCRPKSYGMLSNADRSAILRVTSAISLVALVFLFTCDARAALKHRYSFTSDANDSVGGAHGTVVDAGTMPNFTFTGGQLNLSANAGNPSNNITEDAYVDLPNGIMSGAVNSGTPGAVSFEFWATVATQRTWQRFGDFGTSDGGEDMAPGGANAQYVLITPNSGRYANGLEITNHPASNAAEPNVGLNGPFPLNSQQHVVAVYDHNNTSGGANPNGTMSMYLNGALIGTNLIHPDTNLRTASDNNNWLGRSQWPDPVFDGSYNEFRVYDHALTDIDVGRNAAFGPDLTLSGEVLTLEANKTTGQVRLLNQQAVPVNIDYYEITSAGGALNLSGWNSLDDQEGGDPSGQGWDESGGAGANQLSELFLGGGNDSFPFPASGSRVLGNAYNPAIFGASDGDLVFRFGLPGGGILPGAVSYVTGGPVGVAGDYNGNGVVDAADYVMWRKNVGAASLPNRGTGITGPVGTADYNFWRSRFGATSGAGSDLAAGGVPEPSLCALITCCLAALGLRRVQSNRSCRRVGRR